MQVDLERPGLTVWIEIAEREALLYTRRLPGLGGLPVGVSGTVVALLSGGIDSPVAAFKLIRRGCRAVLLHFHNYTRHQDQVRSKLVDLARVLARFQLGSKLYLVPFEEVQAAIISAVPAEDRMITYRRVMLRMGESVLEREGARAFVTGDSVGQVASQTLDNLHAIHAAARHPVLSPLIGEDKDDIVALARRIGSYEVSIRPYPDCCSFMVAAHPTTRVRLEELEAKEARIPLEALARKALEAAEVEEVAAGGADLADPRPA
jgi:thiamine biosynthesis protein ThiI